VTNFCLQDKLYRDTAPVPFPGFIYQDYISAVYQNCIATAPACNKTCTRTAKSTPYLSCHRDNLLPKVPGPVAGWLRQVTQPPFIAGPSECLKTYPFYYKSKTRHFHEFVNLLITKVKVFSVHLKPVLLD
jgi:hypothetical protein